MSAYTVYYDASGSQQDHKRVLVVAGLYSTVARWKRFEREWVRVLKTFRVPYLHMKEFAHSVEGSPFEKWKGKEEKRAEFLSNLVKVIKHNVNYVYIARILPSDFNTINETYDLSKLGSPYPAAAGHCVGLFENWIRKNKPEPNRTHVLEYGDPGQGLFDSLVQLEGIYPEIKPKVDPRTGVRIRPFEAADLFAYEYGIAYERKLSGDTRRQPRRIFVELRHAVPQQNYGHTLATLAEMCEEFPEMFPRRKD